jgi:L-fuculose-phosphate aldolase
MKTVIQEIIKTGQKLYHQKFIVAGQGNISYRTGQNQILATRSGVCKGELTDGDIVELDMQGKTRSSRDKPSSEIKLHLAVYREREDVQAVIHAHPPFAVSLTLAGIGLDQPLLPESVLLLGSVPTAPYARPSTDQVPDSIKSYIKKTDTLLLERHGSVTVGKNLDEAFQKLEILEYTARIVWLSRQVGNPNSLPASEVEEILRLREKVYGIDFPIISFE